MSFKILRTDISQVHADAAVSTDQTGAVAMGEARETPSGGPSTRFTIRTSHPSWIDGTHGETETVRACYKSCLQLASRLGCESIVFPLIGAESGFPGAELVQTAVSVCSDFLSDNDMTISLAISDPSSFAVSGGIFRGIDAFIDRNLVHEQPDEMYEALDMGAMAGSSMQEMAEASMQAMAAAPMPEAQAMYFSDALPEPSRRRRKLKDIFPSKKKAVGRADTTDSFSETAYDIAFEEDKDSAPVPEKPGKRKRSLEEAVSQVGESFHTRLFRLIDERGLRDPEVYRKANIDRKLFSKIRSNPAYKPRKNTVIALALALELDLDDTRDLLGRVGYALSPASVTDLIIEYFIEQKVFDIYQINLALFDHGQDCLGE